MITQKHLQEVYYPKAQFILYMFLWSLTQDCPKNLFYLDIHCEYNYNFANVSLNGSITLYCFRKWFVKVLMQDYGKITTVTVSRKCPFPLWGDAIRPQYSLSPVAKYKNSTHHFVYVNTRFYKSIEIFWFIHHYITCCGLIASPPLYHLNIVKYNCNYYRLIASGMS